MYWTYHCQVPLLVYILFGIHTFLSWQGVNLNHLRTPLPHYSIANIMDLIPSYNDICHVAQTILSRLFRSMIHTFYISETGANRLLHHVLKI